MRKKFAVLFSRIGSLQVRSFLLPDLILFFTLLIWFFFSYFQWIGDSEFWPISLAGHWDQGTQHPSLLYKAVFHGTLSWIHLWDLSNVVHIKIAKALYAGLGAALVFVLYQILKSKLGSAKALILVLFLLSNSMAFSNLGLIRSDNLATLLLLVLVLILMRLRPTNWKGLFGAFVVGAVPVFFSTPKSVYGILILWAWLFFYIKPSLRLRFLNASMASLAVVLLAIMGLGRAEIIPGLYTAFISALSYHLQAQKHYTEFLSRFNKPYFLKDLVFYAAIIILFAWQTSLLFKRKIPRPAGLMAFTTMGIMTAIAFLIQRPSLPFFLASLLPIIILSLVPVISKVKTQWLMSLLVGSFLYSAVWGHHELLFVSNRTQFTTLDKIEIRLTSCNPTSLIFDALAIFPSKNRIHSIMAYISKDDDMALQGGIQKLQRVEPELVILSGKIVSVSHLFSDFVIENYTSVGKGYWLRKDLAQQCSLDLEDLPMSWKIFGYTTDERL